MDYKCGQVAKNLGFSLILISNLSACGEEDVKSDNNITPPVIDGSIDSREAVTGRQSTQESPQDLALPATDESTQIESIRRQDVSPEEVGVVIYPEAIRLDEHTWKTGDIDSHNVQTLTNIVLFTNDTFTKVATYYRTALSPSKADIFDIDRGSKGKLMSLTTSNADQSSTNVLLTEAKDASQKGTQIKITRMAVLETSMQLKSAKTTATH